jgi:drug/metabolite transporter (DMT)-like permease|tara:strand:- start:6547 stop:7440 length:894 start_codon:yes stop_codon:yes gene_type:complete
MRYYIYLVLAVLFWSGNVVVGRYVSTDISPMELSFFRWFFVVLILSPYTIKNRKRLIDVFKKNPLLYLLCGTLGISAYNTFIYLGVQHLTATNTLLINSSIPIFIIILSSILINTKITKIQSFGILLSTIGVVYLLLKGDYEALMKLEFTKYDLWIILACITWAIYSIYLKFKPKDIKPLEFLSIITFIGVVILFLVCVIFGFKFEYGFLHDDKLLFTLMYVSIFPSILSFYFWNSATYEVGATKAGQFIHLMPVFGFILAYIFLNESLHPYHIVGITFIATGIYLSIFLKRVPVAK